MIGWFKGNIKRIQSLPSYRRLTRKFLFGVDFGEASQSDLILVQQIVNVDAAILPPDFDSGTTNYVAHIHSRLVGYVQLVRHPPENLPYYGHWLFSLQVWPCWRGMGIGEALTLQVINQSIKEGAQELFLLVGEDNFLAISLYEKHGFQGALIPALEKQLEEEQQKIGKRRLLMRKALP